MWVEAAGHTVVSTPSRRRPVHVSPREDFRTSQLRQRRQMTQSSSASHILSELKKKHQAGGLGATMGDLPSNQRVPPLALPHLPQRGAYTARPAISSSKGSTDFLPLPPKRMRYASRSYQPSRRSCRGLTDIFQATISARSLGRNVRPWESIASLEAIAPQHVPNRPLSRTLFEERPSYYILQEKEKNRFLNEEVQEVVELPDVVRPRFGIKQILKKMANMLEVKKYLNMKVAQLDKNVERNFEEMSVEKKPAAGTMKEYRSKNIAATKIQVFLRARWEIQRRVRARRNTRDASLRASGRNKEEVREQRGHTPGRKIPTAEAVAGMYGL